MTAPRRFGLIPAAGTGTRFGSDLPKQYAAISGVPLLRRTIDALNDAIALEAIFIVLAPGDALYAERIGKVRGVEALYCGGATRAESVKNGLAAIGGRTTAEDWVLVHDAVRPCIDVTTLNRLLNELESEPVGGLLAVPLTDTLKRAQTGAGLRAVSTEARDGLWCAQTPQMFRYAILQHAFRQADLAKITDEAQAVEALGVKPRLVQGSPLNIKVTYAEDVALAEAILGQRQKGA
ncbi:MAG TPA: 2-C-methyl-D-erythritol 4-phosphate cytidylyltransferase [Casimicrobiaceae bacterium]|jgi:2-C-methyl-D-erythritol 4-phosphate cytidylyltransferase|nr:2-C-methyl-D-erythritol 4-phosphate cytidylyltransferase [Casimicrobiaceae bacterium]